MKPCPFCAEEIQDAAIVCKHCGRALEGKQPASPMRATINKRSSMFGGGCALQGLGLVCVTLGAVTFLSVIGPLILWPLGLWLLIYGGRRSKWLECSACGTKLANRNLRVCPACNTELQ